MMFICLKIYIIVPADHFLRIYASLFYEVLQEGKEIFFINVLSGGMSNRNVGASDNVRFGWGKSRLFLVAISMRV